MKCNILTPVATTMEFGEKLTALRSLTSLNPDVIIIIPLKLCQSIEIIGWPYIHENRWTNNMRYECNRALYWLEHHIGGIQKYTKSSQQLNQGILTWHRGNRDRHGGSPRARPLHCTTVGLTLAIFPNVDDSGVQFLLGGDCVRAIPWLLNQNEISKAQWGLCRP